MARRQPRPAAPYQYQLEPYHRRCAHCGGPAHVAYHSRRTVATLDGLYRLVLVVRHCQDPACPLYQRAYRPEEEGQWALPQGEFGLDVIALVGALRFAEHRSVPEIHRALTQRGVAIAERTVTHLAQRYEELVALRLADQPRLHERLRQQGRVILAIDGLQPDVGHEVLWVLRDCLSGEVLLARSLLSGTEDDLAALLREVQDNVPVPITGVISDGQHPIRKAVRRVLPEAAHARTGLHRARGETTKPIERGHVFIRDRLRASRGIKTLTTGHRFNGSSTGSKPSTPFAGDTAPSPTWPPGPLPPTPPTRRGSGRWPRR